MKPRFRIRCAGHHALLTACLAASLGGCGGGSNSNSSSNSNPDPDPIGDPPTLSITATPLFVGVNQSSTLIWSSANATDCSASGAWSGAKPAAGTMTVSHAEPGSYSYILTCTGPGGSWTSGTTLLVRSGPLVVSLNITPRMISTEDTATLVWSSSNATSCVASGAWSGNKELNGSTTVSQPLAGNYHYRLTCSFGLSTAFSGSTLTVVPAGILPTTLSANPPTVPVGQTSVLTWSSTGADSCVATGAWSGNLPASGSQTVTVSSPGGNYYAITCTSPTANGGASATIQGLQATVNLSATRTMIGAGQSTTLTWTSTQAQSCIAAGAWSGTLPASGSQVLTLDALGDYTYEITCDDPGTSAEAAVTVSVVAPTTSLRAFPPTGTVGEDFALLWDSPYAQSCTASQDWSDTVATVGSKILTPSQVGTLQYTLTCTNSGGTDSGTVSVNVAAAPAQPPATAFQISPNHAGATTFNGPITFPAAPTWTATLPGPVSYPLIADGRVFVTVGNQGTYGTKLYALDQATGEILWGPVAISGSYSWSGATYEDGVVFVLQFNGRLASFDAASGAPGWSRDLSPQYSFNAPPTAYGGIVFVGGAGSGGALHAVDQRNGDSLWTASVSSGGKSSPTLTPTGVFVTYPCHAYAFVPDTGGGLWHNQHGCSGGGGRTSPAANDVLYARYFDLSINGSVVEFDADSGAELGESTSDTIPAITSTQLFRMNAGLLQAVELSTGSVQWSFAGDGELVTAPIVINDRVIVGSSIGSIYAVDAVTGALVWSSTTTEGMAAPDEQNVTAPTTGLMAGEGYLIAPAGSTLSAWKIVP